MTIFDGTTIQTNRGDKLIFDFLIPTEKIKDEQTGEDIQKFYSFQKGDVLTFGAYAKKKMSKEALLLKDFIVEEETESIHMSFTSEEMKIGPLIDKPTEYYYEIQLNHNQTVLGYFLDGPKIIELYPEGSDIPLKKEEVEEV